MDKNLREEKFGFSDVLIWFCISCVFIFDSKKYPVFTVKRKNYLSQIIDYLSNLFSVNI